MKKPVSEENYPKVMLVEDDESMLSILKTLLDFEGFYVVAVEKDQKIEGINDIITMVREESPSLLLLDIYFRQINGLDVLRHLRKDLSLSDLRILVSSGMDYSRECEREGADGFLLKPYMPDELLKYIRDLVKV
jgi:CheY-like chemotaxis protein